LVLKIKPSRPKEKNSARTLKSTRHLRENQTPCNWFFNHSKTQACEYFILSLFEAGDLTSIQKRNAEV
jgi:hypothetical protein